MTAQIRTVMRAALFTLLILGLGPDSAWSQEGSGGWTQAEQTQPWRGRAIQILG